MRDRRRRALALLAAAAAACWLAVGAAVAHGHGGALLLDRDAGRYAVVLHAAELTQDGGHAVDFTVTLRRDGRPEEAATVELRVRADGRRWSRPYPAQRAANTYEVMLAQPDRGRWRDWDVRVEIDGPGGSATVVHRAEPPTEEEPPPTPALLAALAAVALGAAGLVAVRRRRRAAAPATPADAAADAAAPDDRSG